MSCNCASVLSENHAGAIATIHYDNGLSIDQGGNDSPPIEEARANARLIAAAPAILSAGKHLSVKLAELYGALGLKANDCQAIKDFMALVKKIEGR